MDDFNTLPDDIKLHMFSFLSTKDVVAATSVDHANRALYGSHELWWQRLRVDFGEGAAIGKDPQQLYIQICNQLRNEKRVMAFMLWLDTAVMNREPVFEFDKSIDANADLELIRTKLIMSPIETFLQSEDEIADRYIALGIADRSDAERKVAEADMEFRSLISKLNSAEAVDVIKQINTRLITCAETKSFLSLRHWLRLLPQRVFAEKLTIHHAEYFQHAVRYASLEGVTMLLEFGMDPNLISVAEGARLLELTLDDMGACIYEVDAAVKGIEHGEDRFGTFEELKKYLIERIKTYKSIVATLLANGTDVDLKGGLAMTRAGTLREAARECIREVANVEMPDEEKCMIVEMLQMIADAPVIDQSQSAEPARKKMKW